MLGAALTIDVNRWSVTVPSGQLELRFNRPTRQRNLALAAIVASVQRETRSTVSYREILHRLNQVARLLHVSVPSESSIRTLWEHQRPTVERDANPPSVSYSVTSGLPYVIYSHSFGIVILDTRKALRQVFNTLRDNEYPHLSQNSARRIAALADDEDEWLDECLGRYQAVWYRRHIHDFMILQKLFVSHKRINDVEFFLDVGASIDLQVIGLQELEARSRLIVNAARLPDQFTVRKHCANLITSVEKTWCQLPLSDKFRKSHPIPLSVTWSIHEGPRQVGTEHVSSSPTEAVDAAMSESSVTVLAGCPGGGKSVAMQWLAMEHAKRCLADPEKPLPVYVDLGGFKHATSFSKLRASALCAKLRNAPRILWLMDGLDLLSETGPLTAPTLLQEARRRVEDRHCTDTFLFSVRDGHHAMDVLNRWPISVRLHLTPLAEEHRDAWIREYAADALPELADFTARHSHCRAFLDIPLLFACVLSTLVDSQASRKPFSCDTYPGRAGFLHAFSHYAVNRAIAQRRLTQTRSKTLDWETVEGVFWAALRNHQEDRFLDRDVASYCRQAFTRNEEATLRKWKRAAHVLHKAGLLYRTEDNDGYRVIHQQFAEHWAGKHLASRLKNAEVRGYLGAELWDHLRETRLDEVTTQALSVRLGQGTEGDHFVNEAFEQLSRANPEDAFRLLANIGSKRAVSICINQLKARTIAARRCAVDALHRLLGSEAAKEITANVCLPPIFGEMPWERRARMCPAQIIAHAATDKEPPVQEDTPLLAANPAQESSTNETDRSPPELEPALPPDSPGDRVFGSLKQLGDAQKAEALIAIASCDGDRILQCIRILNPELLADGTTSPAQDQHVALLEDVTNVCLRRAKIWSSTPVVSYLKPYLRPREHILSAAEALRSIGGPDALSALRRTVIKPNLDRLTRFRIVSAIESLCEERNWERIIQEFTKCKDIQDEELITALAWAVHDTYDENEIMNVMAISLEDNPLRRHKLIASYREGRLSSDDACTLLIRGLASPRLWSIISNHLYRRGKQDPQRLCQLLSTEAPKLRVGFKEACSIAHRFGWRILPQICAEQLDAQRKLRDSLEGPTSFPQLHDR